MEWDFDGEIIEWRGPAPFLFVDIDPGLSDDIKSAAKGLEYWGQVAVEATIGRTRFTTALFPKGGRYLLPVKVAVQRAEGVGEGDVVAVWLALRYDR
ncbi:DUF1905 domain-containing protein [Ruania alkalisoli]|uniref:DUF1905 domain-containing protein n=1 Tax=Ruania alkalisoli TaxID=2779775 RepID=A0A7M1SQL4_9MICO|nr:DUF1905 domain-containing protein [Ruania alkalisoli]QOR69856.1 DUF1905 domain-containing protein [Ruania alkalisoli]